MAEESNQRRLAAILAADVVGYSRLMGRDESGTLSAFKTHRHDLVDAKIAEHQGRIVKLTGDGLLVEFLSVVNAVACATDIQHKMRERNADVPADRRIEFRIGINLGDIIIEDDDIFGDGVNIAARIESIARPGGVAVSGSVRDSLGNRLALSFEDTGEQRLKNIERPVRVYNVNLFPDAPFLQPAGVASVANEKPSIAVLPFDNMSGDQEQEYFADGLTEDIITELARNRGLFVIARNSSFTLKGTAVEIAEAGRKLGVRYLVEGSVRRVGKRVRITAQLIEAATGSHVWAERYDRELEDIFAVQDEVTRSIVAAVPGYVETDVVKASRRKPTESLGAYDHYLRGMEIVNRWRNDDIPQAMAEFENAVKLDPNFARAHAAVGHMHVRVYWQTLAPQALAKAKTETELAVRLDGEDSRCLAIRGMCLMLDKNFDAASETFQRALQLTPDDADLNDMMAYYLLCTGQASEAIERSLKTIRASPLFLPASLSETMGMAFMMTGQYEQAIKSFAAIGSAYYYIHVYAAGCMAKLGRIDDARAQGRLANKIKPDWPSVDWGYQYTKEEYREHERELAHLAMDALANEP
ncbi:tetratricopeptide repeat protein [Mesorhizobium sp. B2-4-14]|uniref:adenylate/guanylate cyclase domain-containing protein n=1 Tax=Mesorhizobium sp. B2-4-14 TaxID=2589935 RepID=UPI001127DA65|nr:adenylate/guanylate cyclase domain-containing protein [Mesorhizobium sp. B2-4-14]TPK94194.1 tetratricopeptide repeat protein [Mesorhizobium sp. B2-4-14]